MNKLYVSMYHYTRDLLHSRYPRIKGLDAGLFEEQLKYFSANFNVVSMEDVIEAVNKNKQLPKNSLLLTFDDGYIDNYLTAFPLLKKYGFQGSFFIPGKTIRENVLLDVNKIHFILASADINMLVDDLKHLLDDNSKKYNLLSTEELWERYAIENRFDNKSVIFCKRILQTAIPEDLRNELTSILFKKYVGIPEDCFARELYMTPDQIRIMRQNGMFIGLHGYDHYWLANLTEEQMHRDIDKALDTMSEFIDPSGWVLNYPYGNANDQVIDYIRSKGCVLGMSTEVRVADLDNDDRYMLPRLDCNDFPPKSNNYKNK